MKLQLFILSFFALFACKHSTSNSSEHVPQQKDTIPTIEKEKPTTDSIEVVPVEHASFMMKLNQKVLYFDPVGPTSHYANLPSPEIIVITDIHPDHLSNETLTGLVTDSTQLIAPLAVVEKLSEKLRSQTKVMHNGDVWNDKGITFEAIPMYNLREEAKQFHPKGRGNGYVISANNKRIYVSGDTEGIPEMKSLKNIDLAFICMNLPYTMPVEDAANATLSFSPKKVYPYHYRGANGFSDIKKFKHLVENTNPAINVELLNWYK